MTSGRLGLGKYFHTVIDMTPGGLRLCKHFHIHRQNAITSGGLRLGNHFHIHRQNAMTPGGTQAL